MYVLMHIKGFHIKFFYNNISNKIEENYYYELLLNIIIEYK